MIKQRQLVLRLHIKERFKPMSLSPFSIKKIKVVTSLIIRLVSWSPTQVMVSLLLRSPRVSTRKHLILMVASLTYRLSLKVLLSLRILYKVRPLQLPMAKQVKLPLVNHTQYRYIISETLLTSGALSPPR